MKFNGGRAWGGTLDVYPVQTTKGRIMIGVTNEIGKQFCITVSRWITERRAGGIVECSLVAGRPGTLTVGAFVKECGKAMGFTADTRYSHYRSGEEMARERFLDRE